MRAAGIALLLVLLALVARDAGRSLIVDAGAVGYPFELDYGEGPILAQTSDWLGGRQVYIPLGDGPPYRIANYPPVYHLVSAAASYVTGDALSAGRAVSLASALLGAAAIALLVWWAVAPGAPPQLRALAALLGALSFLRVSYTATWAPLMRVDMLAILFAFGGVVAFAAARTERKVLICAPLLVLAIFTRQSALAAFAACLFVAWRVRPSLALRLALFYVLLAAAALAVLLAASGGWFWFHVVTANVNAYDWQRAAAYLQDAARSHPTEIALALVSLPSLFAGLRNAGNDVPRSAWTRALLGAYLVTSLLVSLTVGKVGSEVNYLIELMGIVCACFAVAVADALAATGAGALGNRIAALAVLGLFLAEVVWFAPSAEPEWSDAGDARRRAQAAQVLERIAAADGPVLSEDMTLLTRAGKEIFYQPFEMTQLARQGIWSPRRFLASLGTGEIRLLVLGFDLDAPPPWELERFSPEMLDAMRRGYEKSARVGGYRLYEPRG